VDPRIPIPAGSGEISAAWLQRALAAGGKVDAPPMRDMRQEQVGVGIGHVGESVRCHLSYAEESPGAPETVFVKLHSPHRKTGLSDGLMICSLMSRSDLQRRHSKFGPPLTSC